jgi:Family of unknown function (DUF6176)
VRSWLIQSSSATPMTYKTEFSTYAVKVDKEARAEEWMRALVERRAECVETLEREKMHYECIFKCVRDGRMYLSWFSVQSSHGARVHDSPHAIDVVHLAFWDECIDRDVQPENLEHVVSFVPAPVEELIQARDTL